MCGEPSVLGPLVEVRDGCEDRKVFDAATHVQYFHCFPFSFQLHILKSWRLFKGKIIIRGMSISSFAQIFIGISECPLLGIDGAFSYHRKSPASSLPT